MIYTDPRRRHISMQFLQVTESTDSNITDNIFKSKIQIFVLYSVHKCRGKQLKNNLFIFIQCQEMTVMMREDRAFGLPVLNCIFAYLKLLVCFPNHSFLYIPTLSRPTQFSDCLINYSIKTVATWFINLIHLKISLPVTISGTSSHFHTAAWFSKLNPLPQSLWKRRGI